MNPRILKKLSKRAVTLLERLCPGLWFGVCEDGESCYEEPRMQRTRHVAFRRTWGWRGALASPIMASKTPMCAWPGTDYCGEANDDGQSAFARLTRTVAESSAVWSTRTDEEGDEWPSVEYPKLRNPSAVLRAARKLAEKCKT